MSKTSKKGKICSKKENNDYPMSLKHIIKYMAVPVVAAFALVGCKHEDLTTAPKSPAEQTETTTKKRTIKLRLSADIELPQGTGERASGINGVGFKLDPTSDRSRPRIKWEEIKDRIRTRLYFRKMVKGDDGQMTPSLDRHDIFSVIIEPNKWTVKIVSNGHLKLSTDIVDPKAAKQRVMEIEVPDGPDDDTHPFIPSSEYPKNTPLEADPGTIVPESNGEWQVAAILSVSLNGDFGRDDKSVSRALEATGAYFPQQYLLSDSKLNTNSSYEEHDTDFEDIDPGVRPFKYDGYWMLYPKTMFFKHNNPDPQEPDPDDLITQDPRQSMEIPFCSDWQNVEIDERGVVGVELKAKSPGMILHYELIPDNVDAKPDPKPIASARGLSLASRRAKQSFRSGGESELGGANPFAVDNLKSTACTFYGALYYDQDGDKVHWSRGEIDLTTYQTDSGEDRFFMKPNTLSVYVRDSNVSTYDLEDNSHCHILYFVMPPYDGESAPTNATTTFWLQLRNVETKDDYSSKADFLEAQPSDYTYAKLSYQLKKKNGTFQNQYVSRTKLSPGKIHWVRLQYKKLAKPIIFDPDA